MQKVRVGNMTGMIKIEPFCFSIPLVTIVGWIKLTETLVNLES